MNKTTLLRARKMMSQASKGSSWRTFLLSFVFTCVLLGVLSHPQTMHLTRHAVSKVGGGTESLQKLFRERGPVMKQHASIWGDNIARFRISFVSPVLQIAVGCLSLLSCLVAADRLFHVYVTVWWRYFTRKNALERFNHIKLEGHEAKYPTVCVQLPMFNETDVCAHVIECAREMQWPRSKLLIQVLDDSTCPETRAIIEESLELCREQGIQTQYRWRSNRTGYKAGAMADAMGDLGLYAYIAVFDADFSPDPDFLLKTVPFLVANPHVGFVQARWTFTNATENVLTRVQTISLNYHIRCEQYARFCAGLFFNNNGTACVWRKSCIEDAGGWSHRSTVEDLDLSLRAHLRGWRFIFLDEITCLNEIPSVYAAYRKQQHRWSAGPVTLWKEAFRSIINSDIPFASKLYLNLFFFGTRMFATHFVSFFFYLLLIPVCATCPEVVIPYWALVYAPILVTLSTCIFTPGGLWYAIPYVLFENAMTIVKLSAMISGLLSLSSANEWVVTTKLGKWVAQKVEKARLISKPRSHTPAKTIYAKELFMGLFFAFCATWGIFRHELFAYSIFLYAQAAVFFIFGLNCIDNL